MGVPIVIKEDDCIGGCKVDAQAACSGTDEENLVWGIFVLEKTDVEVTARTGGGAVEAAVRDSAVDHVIFKDIEHAGELGKEEGAVTILLEVLEEFVQ